MTLKYPLRDAGGFFFFQRAASCQVSFSQSPFYVLVCVRQTQAEAGRSCFTVGVIVLLALLQHGELKEMDEGRRTYRQEGTQCSHSSSFRVLQDSSSKGSTHQAFSLDCGCRKLKLISL